MNSRVCAALAGMAIWCMAGAAGATELWFKTSLGESNKGVIQDIHMYPKSASTVDLDIRVTSSIWCVISDISTSHALSLLELFASGKMSKFTCRVTNLAASTATVNDLSYYPSISP